MLVGCNDGAHHADRTYDIIRTTKGMYIYRTCMQGLENQTAGNNRSA